MGKLIIDGNQVYEIDEECLKKKDCKERELLKQEKSSGGTGKKQNGRNTR